MTEEEVKSSIEASKKLQELIETVVCTVQDLRGIKGSYESHEFAGYDISVVLCESSRCSCCSPEYHYIDFPIRYLWEVGWADEEQARIEADRKAREEAAEAEKLRLKRVSEASERDLLERLKAKYENGENA